MSSPEFLAVWMPSGFEWIIVLVVALLLFGKRLPEVARGLGKGIVEFKKGVRGIEDELEDAEYRTPSQPTHSVEGGSEPASSTPPAASSPPSPPPAKTGQED